jgi:hypothetical protein
MDGSKPGFLCLRGRRRMAQAEQNDRPGGHQTDALHGLPRSSPAARKRSVRAGPHKMTPAVNMTDLATARLWRDGYTAPYSVGMVSGSGDDELLER